MGMKPRQKPPEQWEEIEPLLCDLCGHPAKWKHPYGGLRCDKCPMPVATDDPPCAGCGHPRSHHNSHGHDSGGCTTCPSYTCLDFKAPR